MRRIASLILAAAVLCSGAALAKTEITSAVTTADCDGWSTEVVVTWRTGLPVPVAGADLRVQFTVTDALGAEVAVIDHTEALVRVGENASDTFTVGAAWTAPVCGELTAAGEMRLSSTFDEGLGPSIEEDFADVAATFTCACDPGDDEFACRLGAGYWKNHADMWPAESITFAGADMTRDDAIAAMGMPSRGDATCILAFHLIAAKVNVLNGADDAIADVIAQADDLLAMYGLGGDPQGADRKLALMLKDQLEHYNESGCDPVAPDDGDTPEDKAADSEIAPFGAVKAQYR